ncbi:hypothetical protein MNB_SV-9-708 [hydrothermal vent metagenome]|uniref:Uncharacterized protein n=1 Tax=hydrothermal vent metagenome TaxID=652676 RepID=A0A1W1BWD5_9ZZZZ
MKKILLIEDRQQRQNLFIKRTEIELDSYDDILDNFIGEKYDKLYEDIKNNQFSFSDYALIMVHKGAFNLDNQYIHFQIRDYCKENNTPLVLFSGGATNYYNKEELELMEINSKDFYSNNLQFFLDNFRETKEIELLMLSYGNDWKLNIVLNSLEKVNYFIDNNQEEDILYDEFINKTNFHLLEKIDFDYFQPTVENGWVYLDDIKKIVETIRKYIEEYLTYEE